jgi:NO-binding membrane sensor protein with MHYT domain
MAMWKYILVFTLLVIGIFEIVLALNAGLREAVMKTSPIRFKEAESSAFLLAGISAFVMGGILFYGLLWWVKQEN